MPVVFIRPMGGNLAYIAPLEGPVDPGFGVGDFPGIDNTLPGGRPPHIGNRPPGSWGGGQIDNTLPSGPPPHVPDGAVVVLVKDPAGVWHYATLPPGSPPPVITPPIAPGGTPEPKPA